MSPSSCFEQTSTWRWSPSSKVTQRDEVAGVVHPMISQKEPEDFSAMAGAYRGYDRLREPPRDSWSFAWTREGPFSAANV
jgi:hypothetical protein